MTYRTYHDIAEEAKTEENVELYESYLDKAGSVTPENIAVELDLSLLLRKQRKLFLSLADKTQLTFWESFFGYIYIQAGEKCMESLEEIAKVQRAVGRQMNKHNLCNVNELTLEQHITLLTKLPAVIQP